MLIFLFGVLLFIISVAVHEAAHGYAAYMCGDRTAYHAGRLTLNPLKHIDPVWTVLVPVMLVVLHSPLLFGMAKPVPVNFAMLRRPRVDMVIVAAAGSFANLALALILIKVMQVLPWPVFSYMIMLNLALAFFNLLPVPPLDGGRIVAALLPPAWAYSYGKIEPYGFLIVIVLLMTGIAQQLIGTCMMMFLKMYGG